MSKTNSQHCPGLRSTFTFAVIIVTACIILFTDQSIQFGFQPKLITRFCYNSPNLSTVNSQCVLCNYYMFDATLLGCTGSTALNINITATQAFCVISQCLGQIRQSPVFLGRRRKRKVAENEDGQNEVEDDDDADDLGQPWNESDPSGNETDQYSIVRQVDAEIITDEEE